MSEESRKRGIERRAFEPAKEEAFVCRQARPAFKQAEERADFGAEGRLVPP